MNAPFSGLELLPTAVAVLDADLVVRYVNPAAESLLATAVKGLLGQPFVPLFDEQSELAKTLADALASHWDYSAQSLTFLRPGHEPLALVAMVAHIALPGTPLLVELRPIEQQLRIAREERMVDQQAANRELIRNLAHEIKNPLGGLRGSAQLLERELDKAELKEYTQVIIKEADRLQALMDRLLTPHRTPRLAPLNVHEILERVRSLILAEFSEGIAIRRNYDVSVPELIGDKEQLIQAILNIARNAAQALRAGRAAGVGPARGTIEFRTRIARQVTIVRRRHRLALELQVIDDGPGVAEDIRDKIFNPLVSGREGGSGLGLSLAQTFVQYHQGMIECDSRPGRTVFTILLPLG
ncbi:MAG: PAS domain-containing protein [Proteobacteria bacterium]|nr:PAS domain-containing protein [Pseudomonadota bacterium]